MFNLNKILLPAFICGCLLFSASVRAEEIDLVVLEEIELDENVTAEDLGVNDPLILPDSPFYFTKNWWRGIQSFFTFNPVKKAELKFKFANEKLVELKDLIAKDVGEEKIEKAMNGFKEQMQEVETEIKERKLSDANPEVQRFVERMTKKVMKQQRLLDKFEGQLPSEFSLKIKDLKDKTLRSFTDASLDAGSALKLGERLEKTGEEDPGSRFKHIKNLEVLMRVEDQVPEQAKDAIRKAQANTLKRLKDDLEAIPEQERPVLEQYFQGVGGDELRHLEILSRVEDQGVSSSTLDGIDASKEVLIDKVQKVLDYSTTEEKKVYLNRLRHGDIWELKVINKLEERNLPPSIIDELIEVKQEAYQRFGENISEYVGLEPSAETLEVLEEAEGILPPEKGEEISNLRQGIINETKAKIKQVPVEAEKFLESEKQILK